MAAAVVGAPGYAPRADHGNPESTEYLINPFAQLDAHKHLLEKLLEYGYLEVSPASLPPDEEK